MAERALAKKYNVYLLEFKGARVSATDISSLDPGSMILSGIQGPQERLVLG